MQDALLKSEVKPQILVCDDDAEFSAELVETLAAWGYSANALRTVTAARAAILSPAVLLLDLSMPERDGIEIVTLLSDHPRKDCFKIVLVSGMSPNTLAAAAMFCEVRGLQLLGTLRKPINIGALRALLADA